MRYKDKGIALVELLIVVILISTVATAFWNFYISKDHLVSDELDYSPIDSIADGILDEIAFALHTARPNSLNPDQSISVTVRDNSDEIEILRGNATTRYFVDSGNYLVRENKYEKCLLLSDVTSLRVTALGSETLLLTISLKSESVETDSLTAARSYCKVATVNAAPGGLAQRE